MLEIQTIAYLKLPIEETKETYAVSKLSLLHILLLMVKLIMTDLKLIIMTISISQTFQCCV